MRSLLSGDRAHADRLDPATELLVAEVFEHERLGTVKALNRIRGHEELGRTRVVPSGRGGSIPES